MASFCYISSFPRDHEKAALYPHYFLDLDVPRDPLYGLAGGDVKVLPGNKVCDVKHSGDNAFPDDNDQVI